MKAVLILIALVFIVLFYPRYDLLVKQEFFDENFSVEKTGFMTSKGCHQAAFDMKARYYTCRTRTLMQELLGTYNEGDNPGSDDSQTSSNGLE